MDLKVIKNLVPDKTGLIVLCSIVVDISASMVTKKTDSILYEVLLKHAMLVFAAAVGTKSTLKRTTRRLPQGHSLETKEPALFGFTLLTVIMAIKLALPETSKVALSGVTLPIATMGAASLTNVVTLLKSGENNRREPKSILLKHGCKGTVLFIITAGFNIFSLTATHELNEAMLRSLLCCTEVVGAVFVGTTAVYYLAKNFSLTDTTNQNDVPPQQDAPTVSPSDSPESTSSVEVMTDRLKDEITCCICFEVYRNPYTLPECLHTFCFTCIQALHSSAQTSHAHCPECRNIFSFLNIKKDFKMQKLIDLYDSRH